MIYILLFLFLKTMLSIKLLHTIYKLHYIKIEEIYCYNIKFLNIR